MILTPTQNDLDLFASLSGDANPIHVDPDFAARSGFGRTVAHGAMLTAWLVRAAGLATAPRATSAMFPAPAFACEALKVAQDGDAWQLHRMADDVVVCRLQINGIVSADLEVSDLSTPARPLALGMTAERRATLNAIDQDALENLQARAGEAFLTRDDAKALASQAFMLGQISTLLGMNLPGQGTNYLKQEMAWNGALIPGQSVTTKVTITKLRPEKALVDLRTTLHDDQNHLLGRGRALVSARDVAGAF